MPTGVHYVPEAPLSVPLGLIVSEVVGSIMANRKLRLRWRGEYSRKEGNEWVLGGWSND